MIWWHESAHTISAGIHGEHGGAGFTHDRDGCGAGDGHIKEEMPSAARDFHQGETAPVDQAGSAAEHGVGAFHGFDGDAGALADGYTLADVEAG